MAEISAKLVKDLRDKTGAGMMDCKKALAESAGNTEKAIEWLRQKGIASAEKKAGRTAAEGAVGSYIHTGARVGVLGELRNRFRRPRRGLPGARAQRGDADRRLPRCGVRHHR